MARCVAALVVPLVVLVATAVALDTSHYEVLGLDKTATAAQIRRAYRKLSLQYHPDKRKSDPKAAEKFNKIGEAYEVLGDEDKRMLYDEYGGREFTNQWEFQQAQQRGDVDAKSGFYKSSDIVRTISTPYELKSLLGQGRPTLVEFYAPWCVHCQQMVGSYKKAAVLLEDTALVGAVNCDAARTVCERQRVHSYPTLKFFYPKKKIETTYQSHSHSPEDIHGFVVKQLDDRVVKLTEKNFDDRVLSSTSLWVVDFSAGRWCGPCQAVEPHLRDLAYNMKHIIRVGIVQCDNQKPLCDRMGVPHFPFLKIFHKGQKGEDYTGDELQFNTPHFPALGILSLVDTIGRAALVGNEFDEEDFIERLTEFYEIHNPNKVDKVEALAAKHRGHEEDLIRNLEKRYGAAFPKKEL
eukprot:g1667.t1